MMMMMNDHHVMSSPSLSISVSIDSSSSCYNKSDSNDRTASLSLQKMSKKKMQRTILLPLVVHRGCVGKWKACQQVYHSLSVLMSKLKRTITRLTYSCMLHFTLRTKIDSQSTSSSLFMRRKWRGEGWIHRKGLWILKAVDLTNPQPFKSTAFYD